METPFFIYSMEKVFHGNYSNKNNNKIIPWNSMETAFFIEFNGKRFPWNSMENIPWNSMEFHAQYQTEFHGIPWNSMGLFYTGIV